MALSIDELTELRGDWYQALRAVSTGQSYVIAGRTLTRVDAEEIRRQLAYFDGQLEAVQAGRGPGARVLRVVVVDR